MLKISKFSLFFFPLVLSLCILGICYPGFMSYDSVRMLEEARSSVRGGIYPATPVYLLRLFDFFGQGATFMLQCQNFLVLFSLMLILRFLRASMTASVIALFALIATPTVIGCMLVLWKDVTLASLMMVSIVIIFSENLRKKQHDRNELWKWMSLLFLIVSTLVRFNAITSTAVIALYWLFVYYKDRGWAAKVGMFGVIIFCMILSNYVINNYSFPGFKKLEANNIWFGIMANDLIGISGWSRVSLVPIDSPESEHSPKISLSRIDQVYSSLGILAVNDKNVALGNIVSVFPARYKNEDITTAWLSAVYNHPLAYLKYRLDLFAEIVGAKSYGTFEPTHFNRIDENPFGIKFSDRYVTNKVLAYIELTSGLFFGKPWFVFLLSCISVSIIFRDESICAAFKMLAYYSFASSVFYIAPFFVISGTGEVRYCYPALLLAAIPLFVCVFSANRKLVLRAG